jgi:hypothetical protein
MGDAKRRKDFGYETVFHKIDGILIKELITEDGSSCSIGGFEYLFPLDANVTGIGYILCPKKSVTTYGEWHAQKMMVAIIDIYEKHTGQKCSPVCLNGRFEWKKRVKK